MLNEHRCEDILQQSFINSLRPSDAYMRQWTNHHWFGNGLSPGRRQAIIWTNAGIMLIGPLGTNFSEILIKIYTFWFKKMHLKMSSGKRQPSCLGLNVLRRMRPKSELTILWSR